MQGLRNIITGFAVIILCSIGQPVPESAAADALLSESIIRQAGSTIRISPAAQTIRLAKANKKESKRGENETWRRVESSGYSGDETTKVIIRGNSVLVPVTLVYDNNEVDVRLLLDTGASGTAIHSEIADKLSINLNEAKKTKVRVVGGGVIQARLIRINSLTVGPHTNRDWNIFIVPHMGSAHYDGLLGMDVLRELKYKIDFKKQVIIWE